MTNYDGTPKDVAVISIPDDIDVADAESVNISLRSLKDSSRLALSIHSEAPIHHLVAMSSSDGSTINHQAIPGYMQQGNSFLPYNYTRGGLVAGYFSVADLQPVPTPLRFEIFTVYYCYIVWDPKTATFFRRITTEFPEETLATQKSDSNFAHYVGCFSTDNSHRPQGFQKSGGYYTVEEVQPKVLDLSGAGPATFDLSAYVPKYCNRVKFRVELYNTSTIGQCILKSDTGPEQSLTMPPSSQVTVFCDLILRGAKTITARLSGGTEVALRLEGYWES